MDERKRLVFTAISVSLVAIVTGLFLGGGLFPSRASSQQYAEKTTSLTIDTIVVEHSHDGLPMHKHIVKTTITKTETTPHGYFHDFGPSPALQSPPISETTPSPTQPEPKAPETAPAPVSTRGDNEVWLFSRDNVPGSLTVPAGTTVTWINKDTYIHNVASVDKLFTETLLPGGTFSYTFSTTGIFNYYCEMHPEIAGTVFVK